VNEVKMAERKAYPREKSWRAGSALKRSLRLEGSFAKSSYYLFLKL